MTHRPFRIDAVIFDLDGTLADTFPLIVSSWNAAITPHTGKTYSDNEVIARFGIPDPAMLRREVPQAAWESVDQVFHAHYASEHGSIKAFDGIDEMLAELRRQGVPLGLCTGKGRRTARITLEALGWSNFFHAVVTGEDVKEQKPSPAPVLRAAEMLKVPPQRCAFVGDSPADLHAGKAAGMITVAAGWHPVYLEHLRALKPDVWAEKPADVVRVGRRNPEWKPE